MQTHKALLTALATLGAVTAAAAEDGKSDAAVSAPTVTVMGIAGSASGKATGGGAASVAVPVTERIGLQFDAAPGGFGRQPNRGAVSPLRSRP